MRLLLIDNFDSFSNNVADRLRRLGPDVDLSIVTNDAFDIFDSPDFARFDAFVISPGPGNPANAADLGICARLLAAERRPMLGVCLGHQAIAHAAGAEVVHAPEPVHGRSSPIAHDGSGIFAGLPPDFEAMRYHSWVVREPLPDTLRPTAWTGGLLMGIAHRLLPRWGVQFHPESVGTPDGIAILRNFLSEVRARGALRIASRAEDAAPCVQAPVPADTAAPLSLRWRALGPAVDPTALAEAVRAQGGAGLLLESALLREGLSRFSYVAAPAAGDEATIICPEEVAEFVATAPDGGVLARPGTPFDALREIARPLAFPDGVPPFDFHGGAVGWFGYELRGVAARMPVPRAGHPLAAFQIVKRFLVVDHALGFTYGAVVAASDDQAAAVEGFAVLAALHARACEPRAAVAPVAPPIRRNAPVRFVPRHDDAAYLRMVRACQGEIIEGESYELCLTNRITAAEAIDPWALYHILRGRNPAPYAAFLPLGGLSVVGSSPECFLRVEAGGRVVARPIKGTIRRVRDAGADAALRDTLARSSKDRAENMMIVDLLRHDLTAVCTPGTVEVPALNAIESYETVHQMVSTIEGCLRPGLGAVDVLMACFPGGSMTGAPKRRSMEILDRLEAGPRGVYSGALGWIGFDGLAELSIVIRSAICRGGEVAIGCGGAITTLSDPLAELDEMKLKARALMQAVAEAATGDGENYVYQGGTPEARAAG